MVRKGQDRPARRIRNLLSRSRVLQCRTKHRKRQRPGLNYTQNLTTLGLGNTYFNFASPNLPIPLPAPASVRPLEMEPFNVRINPLVGFDDERMNPYVQNYSLEVQRELDENLTFEARYIGTKGTKLYGGVSLNDVNIFARAAGQTLLDAFNMTRA